MKTKDFGGFKHGAALLWKYSIWVKKDLKEQCLHDAQRWQNWDGGEQEMPSHTMLFIQFLSHIFIVCIYLFGNINIYIFTSKRRFFLLDQAVEGALK